MYKLLVVDDEPNIREIVKEYSIKEGYEFYEAADGQIALDMIKEEDFDIILLDIMMPNLDGYTTCREIKAIRDIPIIMISARNQEFDKLHGFEIGIDDYVTKPFSNSELFARIKAVLERSNSGKKKHYEVGGLVVDAVGRTLSVDGERVDVTPKEFDLLVYFIRHPKQALSRDTLLDRVWRYNFFGDFRTVDTHIKMLRQTLGPYRHYITTVRSIGYKFEVKDQ